jgi:hypothetical protein
MLQHSSSPREYWGRTIVAEPRIAQALYAAVIPGRAADLGFTRDGRLNAQIG